MGYLSWGTKPSKKGGAMSGGGRGGAKKEATRPPAATVVAAAAASGGCMNAVLHMFDFQRFHLCLHPQLDHHDYPPPASLQPTTTTTAAAASFSVDYHPNSLNGVEAPRNSLESDEMVTGGTSLASITGDKNDDVLHISVGIEINTSRRDTKPKLVQAPRGKSTQLEETPISESSNSPGGARTPGLVARLMGLDILPESTTTTTPPRPSLHSPHTGTSAPPRKARPKTSYDMNYGPHSLPETPRRLSLQINKENSIVRKMESSRPSCSAINTKRKEGKTNYYEELENRSPGYYARQIMKQVRETVSRRVGVDITNTINNNSTVQRDHRRDEHLLTLSTKPRKPNKLESNTNPSAKLKPLELPSSKITSSSLDNISSSDYVKSEALQVLSVAVKPPPKPSDDADEEKSSKSSLKKKALPKSFDSIRNKKEEQFVRPDHLTNKKCKKTPLSSDLLHGSVPSLVHFKKDLSRFLHKQGSSSKAQPSKLIMSKSSITNSTGTGAQLSRSPSEQVHEKINRKVPAVLRRGKDSNEIAEFQYVSRLLKCTGIDRDTPVTLARWFSSSHPLDPSIFHSLEAAHYADHQPGLEFFNRRLIFHLVDEILADLLKPYIKLKSGVMFGTSQQYNYNDHQQIYGFQLVKILCTRICSFPSADCQTLQDIDALVEKDMPRTGGVQSDSITLEEEGDAVVSEIECVVLDSLVHEVALLCLGIRIQRHDPMQRYVSSIRTE
ncbi:hypothetical protein Cgig2_030016 [Carnegiea gigantea]|uniref:DUF3741 domain-containing protein n=1 Tax=Carnegiea gigantea TaxID=171969 RepID=A0A9Q1K6Z8_9CARY|nr:hypothetical protein Cgig2_030016 [Carnegiea gigantea]